MKICAEVFTPSLQAGHADYKVNAYFPALMEYLLAAEAGISLATMNAAYIIERGLAEWPAGLEDISTSKREMTRKLYSMAAAQGDAEAAVRNGELALEDGDREAAKASFELALSYNGNHSRSLYNMASFRHYEWTWKGWDERELELVESLLHRATNAHFPHNAPAYLMVFVVKSQEIAARSAAWSFGIKLQELSVTYVMCTLGFWECQNR